MLSVVISPKGYNYPRAYTVPTKGQMTASRKNNKMKYIQMGPYTVPTKAR
jgi:hypothetical protein